MTTGQKQWSQPFAMTIDPSKSYSVTIKTSKGSLSADLYAADAPNTVNNFVNLAREGFYDGTVFHRIIAGFMFQGGDPTGTGTGGPGYRFNDELKSDHSYQKGTLAMANAGPNTNGSQFFVCLGDLNKSLPKNYNIFGQVNDGMDVVDAIGATRVTRSRSGENSQPVETVTIESVTVTEK